MASIKKITHDGPVGAASIRERIRLNNRWASRIGENCGKSVQGYSETADHVIANFVIDDGVSDRGHRTNMYSVCFNSWGVGVFPSIENGKKVDWITTFFARTGSCCTTCPLSASVRNTIGWTGVSPDL